MDNFDELFRRLLLPRPWFHGFVKNVTSDVALQQLGHETIQGAPAGRYLLQYFMTIGFLDKRTLNRFHLSLDPADASNQLRLITFCVRHNDLQLYSPPV